MHPGAALFLWSALVVLLQTATGLVLAGMTGVGLIVAGVASGGSLRRLVRRIRFLLLAILILFAWMTPGQAAVPFWTVGGPSREGLLLAAEHGLRLLGVVSLVALLLGRGGRDFVVSGLYALMAPSGFFGLSRDRLAVRLLLVLRHAEQPQGRTWRHWLDVDEPGDLSPLHVQRRPIRGLDWLVMGLGAAMIGLGWR